MAQTRLRIEQLTSSTPGDLFLRDDMTLEDCSGSTGLQGIQGSTGLQGIQGEQGIQGIQGEQGIQGIQGETGLQGAPGTDGAKGVAKTGDVTSTYTGDDGDLQVGISNASRFTDNGDGTLTDTLSGLQWAKDPTKIIQNHTGQAGTMQGTWAPLTAYSVGDVVDNSLSNTSNLPAFIEDEHYYVGNIVQGVDGQRYICTTGYLSSNHEPGNASTYSPDWATYWTQETIPDFVDYHTYTSGDRIFVWYSGAVYTCNTSYFATDYQPGVTGSEWADKWEVLIDSTSTPWADGANYTSGQIVWSAGDGRFFQANEDITDEAAYGPAFDGTEWSSFSPAYFAYFNNYSVGDQVIVYDSVSGVWSVYQCTVAYTPDFYNPFNYDTSFATYWTSDSISYWSGNTAYLVNDEVIDYDSTYTYHVYKCIVANDASTREPGTGGYYSPPTALNWTDNWYPNGETTWWYGNAYNVGDIVTGPNYYPGYQLDFVCISAHTSDSGSGSPVNQPMLGASWSTYWQWIPTAYVCIEAHTSNIYTNQPYWGGYTGIGTGGWTTYWQPTVWVQNGTTNAPVQNIPYLVYLGICSGTTAYHGLGSGYTGLSYAGHTDWRMPNVRELFSLIDFGAYNPALFTGYGFGHMNYTVWSSTADQTTSGNNYCINLYGGGNYMLSSNSISAYDYDSVFVIPCRS